MSIRRAVSDWGIYAFVCDDCGHLANRHTLVDETVAGLYQCPCGCNITASAPLTGLTRAEYEERKADLIPS